MARSVRSLARRLLAPFAGLALAGALIAGCAPAPGTAATVDGHVIGEDEVATVVEELSLHVGPVTPAQAIAELVRAEEILDVASGAGFGVSATDAAGVLDRIAGEQGFDPIEPSAATLLVVRSLVASSGMQTAPDAADLFAELDERIAGLDIEVSPRYGSWDGQAITPQAFEWIEQPAPDAA
ncbi:hypothetical protein [Pseudactinotalea suaedae]|uniref:hypothetical protein n=1 Tax=Pseudactinotalea suaedae TaxID=1524924 RepID=UPI0012E1A131|nr:hypothetical protein [Pseudactinotalea suaedae]